MYTKDKWLSDQFRHNIYNFKKLDIKSINKIDKLYPKNFIFFKTNNLNKNKEILKKLNFYLVEKSILFCLKINKKFRFNENCRLVTKKDKKEILNLAKKSFIYSRFFQDKNIDKKIAEKVKVNWLKNYFLGKRGSKIIVHEINGKLSGFILLIYNKKNLFIDLIAVNKKLRGNNIGSLLIESSINFYKKCKYIYAGTQLANKASINFYKKNKFIVVKKSYTFHRYNK